VYKLELLDNGRSTKVPYSPITGNKASSTDPTHWGTFEQAIAIYNNGHNVYGFSGIGFMLNDGDPFNFVDLDDPWALNPDGTPKNADPAGIQRAQQDIFTRFAGTYMELSQSGKGLHIISLGITPRGKRVGSIEMYSHARFMVMTGNVVDHSPITDRQDAINWLYAELSGVEKQTAFTGTFTDRENDQAVIDRCLAAANGQLFRDLAHGDWQQHYTSQSEADFALIDILAYFTDSRFQIARIFRMSALGQRDKASRDNYVFGMVDKAFDLHPPPIDMDAIKGALDAEWNKVAGNGTNQGSLHVPAVPHSPRQPEQQGAGPAPDAPTYTFVEDEDNPYRKPVPGLLGQIAYYIYAQAPRPVPEIALAGAIGLMAGICGRSYNVSGTGLNQYTLLLARTGRGKEAINSGIAKLMNAVAFVGDGGGNCPGAREFVGPTTISSGQALVKHLDKAAKSFVSVLGEVDLTLKNMTSRNANAGLVALKQTMLRAYSASGRGETLGQTIYSDKDKNTGEIVSPAFSIVGEGTPARFYAMLDEDLVADGLLPRFTIIEYDGDRVPLNIERANVQPSPQLIRAVAQLCGYSLMLNQQNKPVDVQLTKEAQALLHQFDLTVDGIMNKAANDVIDQLWNRAYLKAIKMASLMAIGLNMTDPVITAEFAEYAINMVKRDTSRLVARFVSGDVGDGMSKQAQDMRKAFKQAVIMPPHRAEELGMNWQMQQDRLVPKRFIQQSLANIASFKNAKEGGPRAIENNLRMLMDGDIIAQVGATQLAAYGKARGIYYAVTQPTWLTGGVQA